VRAALWYFPFLPFYAIAPFCRLSSRVVWKDGMVSNIFGRRKKEA
jgi:hypothetical protein